MPVAVKPKVSIVIPVYNGADYLGEAIESVLGQTYKNIEVIVVNDGSSDGGASERIALNYGARIRYLSKPNGGVASALNLAIREATGSYISWLSHDDLYVKDKVERQLAALESLPPQDRDRTVVYSDYAVFSSERQGEICFHMKDIVPEQFRYWITTENALHGCTLLIPKLAFEECGVFSEELRTTQDYDLWFRFAQKYRFIHVPKVLVKARSHAEQGTQKMAGLAKAECEVLLAGFVRRLTIKDFAFAAPQPLAITYLGIVSNMWSRGFQRAGWVAALLSLRSIPAAPSHATKVLRMLVNEIAHYYITGQHETSLCSLLAAEKPSKS